MNIENKGKNNINVAFYPLSPGFSLQKVTRFNDMHNIISREICFCQDNPVLGLRGKRRLSDNEIENIVQFLRVV